MLIGLAGATITGYGAQKLAQTACDNAKLKSKYNSCIKAKKSQAVCKKESEPKQDIVWKVMQYGGCGLIVGLFIILAVLSSGFSLGGMGGGYQGGMGYQQGF